MKEGQRVDRVAHQRNRAVIKYIAAATADGTDRVQRLHETADVT